MKTTKVFFSAILAVMMLFMGPFASSTLNSQEFDGYEEFDWSQIYPDGFDGSDVYEGGDLGEAEITCSSGSWGRCYIWVFVWQESDFLFGNYTCYYTGYPKNYCHHLYAKIANFLYLPSWINQEE